MSPLAAHLARRRLVVFDVDGTLYAQRPVRLAMAAALLRDAAWRRSTDAVRVLRAYRRAKEELADREAEDFEPAAVRAAAQAAGLREDRVRELVADWMLRRPLPHLARATYPGVAALISNLRAGGILVAALSDYPARDKLHAMGIDVDLVVAASDEGVRVQKPHPKGLLHVLERTGCRPAHAVLIGDRVDRDGLAAERAGVSFLLRAGRGPTHVARITSYLEPPIPPENG